MIDVAVLVCPALVRGLNHTCADKLIKLLGGDMWSNATNLVFLVYRILADLPGVGALLGDISSIQQYANSCRRSQFFYHVLLLYPSFQDLFLAYRSTCCEKSSIEPSKPKTDKIHSRAS